MPRGFKNAKKKQNDEKVIEYYDNEELIQWILCDSYIREQTRNKIYKENEDIINLYEYNINYYTNLIYDLQHIDHYHLLPPLYLNHSHH